MSATFNPGRANQRIRLQAKSVIRNAIGEELVTWTDVVTDTTDHALWAEAWPLKGREFFAAQQTRYAADVRFLIRFRADVVREQRILWRDEPYDIVMLVDVGAARHTLEILAVNGIRNGL
ncbi:MAG TPA: phage head closure protein [Accumulibacter sp.]|nr:phage head closure protein [Accumulibacter sp.]